MCGVRREASPFQRTVDALAGEGIEIARGVADQHDAVRCDGTGGEVERAGRVYAPNVFRSEEGRNFGHQSVKTGFDRLTTPPKPAIQDENDVGEVGRDPDDSRGTPGKEPQLSGIVGKRCAPNVTRERDFAKLRPSPSQPCASGNGRSKSVAAQHQTAAMPFSVSGLHADNTSVRADQVDYLLALPDLHSATRRHLQQRRVEKGSIDRHSTSVGWKVAAERIG